MSGFTGGLLAWRQGYLCDSTYTEQGSSQFVHYASHSLYRWISLCCFRLRVQQSSIWYCRRKHVYPIVRDYLRACKFAGFGVPSHGAHRLWMCCYSMALRSMCRGLLAIGHAGNGRDTSHGIRR